MATVTDQSATFIEQFLLLLSQKERFVIERRFNLDNKQRATLEEIGQHFSVTRERIRQIEKNALNKLRRNLENFPLKDISDLAFQLLQESGRLMKEDVMLSQLINVKSSFLPESLQLILAVDRRFDRIPNTVYFHPHLRFPQYNESFLQNLSKQVVQLLKKNKDTVDIKKLIEVLKMTHKDFQVEQNTLLSFLQVDKKIKLVENQRVGLVEWRHINPRTLRDKIFYVLRREQKPMHFVDIANRIIESGFDRKKVNLQAVHNELIRFEEFVLVGRGIYGLKEWGYVPGTVADIIEELLGKKESMSQDEIIQEVLKQRYVKPITIILSLKNKKQFVRVGRKQYSLAT